jgi:hypothetical protein
MAGAVAAAIAAGTLFAPSASAARVAWGVSIGVPGLAVTAGAPYYGAPYRPYYRPYYRPRVVYPAPVAYVAPYPYAYAAPTVAVTAAPYYYGRRYYGHRHYHRY